MTSFNVVNFKTNTVVATCKTKDSARKVRDRKDLAYGMVTHKIVEVRA
jgi:hypothetical protein